MTRNKRITVKDMFYFYPYKKNIVSSSNTIPDPYVKKNDECPDHPLSIDYNDWLSVVKSYIDLIIATVLSGREFILPQYMGSLQLRKYKTRRLIDWKSSKEQEKKIYFKGNNSYHIILKWYRDKAKFQYKHHWKIRMGKKLGNSIYKNSVKNYNYIYNILDI